MRIDDLLESLFIRLCVETGKMAYLNVNVEVVHDFAGLHSPYFHFMPVGFALILRHDDEEGVVLVVGQCAGVAVGAVVDFLHHLLHLLACLFGDVGAVVKNPVYRSHGDARFLSNVFDSYFLSHDNLSFSFFSRWRFVRAHKDEHANVVINLELCERTAFFLLKSNKKKKKPWDYEGEDVIL